MDETILTKPWRSKEHALSGLALAEQVIANQCSNGQPFTEFLAQLRAVERSPCTTVWKVNSYAYRCRDCQVTESSAICVECFKAGPHAKHDYIMYRSAAGGCCDCGDPVSLKEEGFCSLHSHNGPATEVLPERTLLVFHSLVSLLLARLLEMIGLLQTANPPPLKEAAEMVLKWLQQVCSVRALREVVCEEMVRDSTGSAESRPGPGAPLSVLLKSFVNVPGVAEEETTLFLLMLYRHQFKEAFSRVLLWHYSDWILSNVHNEEKLKLLDSCLDRVMVQLINVEDITLELIKHEALLDCFLTVLKELLKKAIDPNTSVVNCNHTVIKDRLYTRPLSDLRLIISHNEVGLYILRSRPDLLSSFLELLESIQYMQPYHHLSFPDLDLDQGWMHAVSLEVYMTTIVSQLVNGCYALLDAPETPSAVRTSVLPSLLSGARRTQNMLLVYFNKDLRTASHNSSHGFLGVCMSLHIPLHRAFGMMLAKLLQAATSAATSADCQTARACLQDLAVGLSEAQQDGMQVTSQDHQTMEHPLPGNQIMEYPLRIVFWMAEIRGRQWRHQGEDLARLERVYTSAYWNEQAFDMDVLVLQYCIATAGEGLDEVLLRMLWRYKIEDILWKERRLSTDPSSPDSIIRSATLARMLELMRLLLMLVRERRHVSMSETEVLRYEVIQWLCYKDMTYSTLSNFLPQTLANHSKLEEVLRSVATYMVPKLQERGFYRLKPECWREFDVLFSHYSKTDLEEALSRAVDIGKVGSFWRLPRLSPAQAPFDALCNILHSQIFHRFLFIALDQSLQLLQGDGDSTLGETLAIAACQLITTAALDDRQGPGNRRFQRSPPGAASINWPFVEFASNDIAVSMRKETGQQGPGGSMLDLLARIRRTTNAARLLDCIQYVHETTKTLSVDLGKQKAPQMASEAGSDSPDAESRRKLKKQRQAAILADFAARQKAFLNEAPSPPEPGDPSVPAAPNAEDGSPRVGTTSHDEAGPSGRGQSHQCAFCLADQEMNASPMGWIAFIQMSNVPAVSNRQLQPVQHFEEAAKIATGRKDGQTSDRLLCAELVRTGPRGPRGYHPYEIGEHVGCCGHQMHLECFQRYVKALGKKHDRGRMYEGFGLINLARIEYLCPICRRLANFLLPDVDTGPSRMFPTGPGLPEASDAPVPLTPARDFYDVVTALSQSAGELSRTYCKVKYTQYESWCEQFVSQCRMLRLESQPDTPDPDLESPGFIWKELWSILAANVVHCEIETRGTSPASPRASSSSDTENELLQLWGGETSRWRALRALAKLAVVSTSVDSEPTTQRVVKMFEWRCPFYPGGSRWGAKTGHASAQQTGHSPPGEGTERSVEGGQSTGVHTTPRGATAVISGAGDTQEEPPGRTGEASEAGMTPDNEPGRVENGQPGGSLERNAVGSSDRGDMDEAPVQQGSPGETSEDEWLAGAWKMESVKKGEGWDSPLLQDPFEMLVFLFQTHVSFPSHSAVLGMVNVAFHVAAAQAFLAASALRKTGPSSDAVSPADAADPDADLSGSAERRELPTAALLPGDASADASYSDAAVVSVMEAALVPFLRKAAILVQVVSGRLPPVSGPSDGDPMDCKYWQRYFGLPDLPSILKAMGAALTIQGLSWEVLRQHWNPPRHLLFSGPTQLKLIALPDVCQELLLSEMNRKCARCGTVPKEAALCLLCGAMVCCKSPCCKANGQGECFRHAAECGLGIGIFLLLRSTQMLILRSERGCMAPSVYLDAHGEEDAFLKRGRPLRLSRLRYDEIERMWLTGGLDQNSQLLHSSHLGSESL